MSPTWRIASITSSQGMGQVTSASARSAADRAMDTAPTLRNTHGTSTSPRTGSHTSPSKFISAKAQASAACLGEPPRSVVSAAAVMPAAEPHSA